MIVLAFHSNDHMDAAQAIQDAKDEAPNARIVGRNGDLFSGWIERLVGRDPVVAIHAPRHPAVVEAYAAAGIPALEITTERRPLSDEAPIVIDDSNDILTGKA